MVSSEFHTGWISPAHNQRPVRGDWVFSEVTPVRAEVSGACSEMQSAGRSEYVEDRMQVADIEVDHSTSVVVEGKCASVLLDSGRTGKQEVKDDVDKPAD